MSVIDTVEELVEPLLREHGFSLYDLEQAGPVLRVVVDRDGGVNLDQLAAITRVVSRELDEHDPVPSRYTLEVTSPGLERPLRRREHYETAVGSKISLKRGPESSGERRLTGELLAVDDTSITIAGSDGEQHRVTLDSITSARTVFEWGPTPKPGATKTTSSSESSSGSTPKRSTART